MSFWQKIIQKKIVNLKNVIHIAENFFMSNFLTKLNFHLNKIV